jgi:5-methylcytosine-specific restriction endonuclease McrA
MVSQLRTVFYTLVGGDRRHRIGNLAVALELHMNPALVLNADYRPLRYFPLSLLPWQDTVRAVFLERVSIVAEYDQVVRSATFSMRLPSVVALKRYINGDRTPAFTRFNLFLRDRFTCQYCGAREPVSDLTFDHVLPRSRGGRTSWGNVVAACAPCNFVKGNHLIHEIGMRLIRNPRAPTERELHARAPGFPPNYLHESWRDYLYWDTELESD